MPRIYIGFPFLAMIVGTRLVTTRLCGFSPFGWCASGLKFCISLFRMNPAPSTVCVVPKRLLNVIVSETAFPSESMTDRCVVFFSSATPGRIFDWGAASEGSIERYRLNAKFSEVISSALITLNSGSPLNVASSLKTRLNVSLRRWSEY